MRVRFAALVAMMILTVLLPACQLSEATGPVVVESGPAAESDTALGNPEEEWPRTLPALRAFALPEAQRWQETPVLADLTVWLDPTGAWERVRLTYVAGDAERMLVYRSRPDDLRVERPRLEGLSLPELPTAAVEEVPSLPQGTLEPVALAEAAASALAECGVADLPVRAVLYATGAPATWDGSEWTRTPTWRATVVTEEAGVTVDPTSGTAFAPLTCLDPFILDQE